MDEFVDNFLWKKPMNHGYYIQGNNKESIFVSFVPPFLRPTPIHIDDLTWYIRVVV